jgi:Skp family chaperone for outer membrane proteins
MKKLTLLAVFGLLTLGTYAQKFGHVFAESILTELKIKKNYQSDLDSEQKRLENLLSTFTIEFENKVAEFQIQL